MTDLCVKRIKSQKISTREELQSCEKEHLINRILQLEAHNLQLKNIIEKPGLGREGKVDKSKRSFDFTKCHKRHILLKFYYLGWEYDGFVTQEDTINTVEQKIFAALTKACLIENRESSCYHRCGRTDKGVSAFSQVISLDIRSKLKPEDQSKVENELQYCKVLNRILPKSIRCVSWAPVSQNISARFDCNSRSYRYYFPLGNLNIAAMNKAASYLVGLHDFRNICKMDVSNGVTKFDRNVDEAKIVPSVHESDENVSGYTIYKFVIKSRGFLWHQIRAIMAILFLVGEGKEHPEIVRDLLDIEKFPRKPQYNLAHEAPLNLFDCDFGEIDWIIEETDLINVIKELQEEWTLHTVKSSMMREMLTDLENKIQSDNIKFQSDCLLPGTRTKVYQPLIKRKTCESLVERIEHFKKKQRIQLLKETQPVE